MLSAAAWPSLRPVHKALCVCLSLSERALGALRAHSGVCVWPQWFAKARRQAELAMNRAASVGYDPLEDPKYAFAGADADDENPIRAREPSRERLPVMRARPFCAWAVSACSALSAMGDVGDGVFSRGALLSVPTVDGDVDVVLPTGTQPGTTLRIEGKGVPKLNQINVRGSHFLKVKVLIPKSLSSRERDLITQLKMEGKGR